MKRTNAFLGLKGFPIMITRFLRTSSMLVVSSSIPSVLMNAGKRLSQICPPFKVMQLEEPERTPWESLNPIYPYLKTIFSSHLRLLVSLVKDPVPTDSQGSTSRVDRPIYLHEPSNCNKAPERNGTLVSQSIF